MKKLKPFFAKFLCIILCIMIFSGCGKETNGRENGNLPEQGNVFGANVSGQDASGKKPSGGTNEGAQSGGAQGDGNFSDGVGNTSADGEAGTDAPDQSDGFGKDGMGDGKTSQKGDGQLPQATAVVNKEQMFGLLTNYKEKTFLRCMNRGTGKNIIPMYVWIKTIK